MNVSECRLQPAAHFVANGVTIKIRKRCATGSGGALRILDALFNLEIGLATVASGSDRTFRHKAETHTTALPPLRQNQRSENYFRSQQQLLHMHLAKDGGAQQRGRRAGNVARAICGNRLTFSVEHELPD